jgi:peroxiredoxin
MKTKIILNLLVLLLICTGTALAIEVGSTPPDFKLPTIEGKDVKLSDYQGRIILLKLATTWCPTCKQQSQEIAEAGKILAENEVVVIEVFLQDSEEMIREALAGQTFAMDHVALLDDGDARRAYAVYMIPRLLIIDRDFKVRRDGSLMTARDLIREVQAIAGK